MFLDNSREIVDGDLPITVAISRNDFPCALRMAISSRSANLKQRPCCAAAVVPDKVRAVERLDDDAVFSDLELRFAAAQVASDEDYAQRLALTPNNSAASSRTDSIQRAHFRTGANSVERHWGCWQDRHQHPV